MIERRTAAERATVAATIVVAMITSPMPSACMWKSLSPASNFTSASSRIRSSTSRTPTRPWTAGRASIAPRAQRVSSTLKRTIEAPPSSAQTIASTPTSSTHHGGTRHVGGSASLMRVGARR